MPAGRASVMSKPAAAASDTEMFFYTGAAQSTTVPAGQNFVTVDLIGGGGANAAGRVQGKFAVTPAASVQVNVGGTNLTFNGGGSAALNAGCGATDIRIGGTGLGDRKFVAGGAGGTGIDELTNNLAGGAGGGTTGNPGQNAPYGGGGGTPSAGGAAGTGNVSNGVAGSSGQGGTSSGASGGGGGYFGGGGAGVNDTGGGENYGGGGGGSSYADALATAVTHTQGYASAGANGTASLTWSVL